MTKSDLETARFKILNLVLKHSNLDTTNYCNNSKCFAYQYEFKVLKIQKCENVIPFKR